MNTSTPLAILFLLAALFSIFELFRSRGVAEVESYIADREAQATHVLMNGGMAAMVAPFYSAMIGRGIVLVYGVAIAFMAVRLWLLLERKNPAITNRVAGSIYHLLGLAAMIYAVYVMPAEMMMMGGHRNWIASALGALFLLDGAATAVLVGLFPALLIRMERAIDGAASRMHPRDTRTVRAIRIAAIPHCIMDIGMALMLLG